MTMGAQISQCLWGQFHSQWCYLEGGVLPTPAPPPYRLRAAAHLLAQVMVHPVHLLFPEKAPQFCGQLLGGMEVTLTGPALLLSINLLCPQQGISKTAFLPSPSATVG